MNIFQRLYNFKNSELFILFVLFILLATIYISLPFLDGTITSFQPVKQSTSI